MKKVTLIAIIAISLDAIGSLYYFLINHGVISRDDPGIDGIIQFLFPLANIGLLIFFVKLYQKQFFLNPFSFEGRIRRSEFGISLIIYALIYVRIYVTMFPGHKNVYGRFDENPNIALLLFILLLIIPMLWFLWAQAAKRCHDLGKSGWYQLIPFYVFWLLFQEGQAGENEYGEIPKASTES